ncbi:hypothetical protein [Rubinisphaera margarita]|uniref:hypothetical protein n=1 Tax=Rubinisphaera margarita TaxID=2909586 RepID=UPI001EE880FC|nr:hypothetical protein [Rubinisphaera margarita]MCG6154551.1 hypothetical protein [Rubinisphaera margarita]
MKAMSIFRRLPLLFLLAFMLSPPLLAVDLVAAEIEPGELEGALWKFDLTPKGERGPMLTGFFRVSDGVLYQKTTRESKEFDKSVGKLSREGRDKTRVELEDFRAFGRNKNLHDGLSGTLLLKFERFGNCSGTFIDGDGKNWNIRCVRVQE